MSQARIETGSNGRMEIHGDLNFASVALLWNASRECLRHARETGKTIRFFNIPAQMLAIARVSALDEVLPLHRD